MTGWTEGYVGGIDYIRAFYRELSPSLLSFALLLRGWRPPAELDGAFAYAELGCGHGVSSAVLAAAHPTARFEAVDFNPAHIAGAQRLAAEAGLDNAAFLEESFADYAATGATTGAKDLDMVALHGVWSWVSAENRAILVDLLRRRLKPGGLVFVSYNALPGTLAYMPLRRILVEHTADRSGDLPERIEQAVGFAGRLAALNAGWFRQADEVPARLESLARKSPNYIAHEYLNSDWTAFYHADVARELAGAKLDFAGPSVPMEQIDELALDPNAIALIQEVRDPAYRETLRDVLTNRAFRRDLFVKGAERLTPAERRERLRATRFTLLVPAEDVPEVAITPVGRIPFPPDLYGPLAEALAGGVPSLEELTALPALARHGEDAVLRALMMLTSLALASPALPESGLAERKNHTDRFNAAVLDRNRTDDALGTLASPVIGSGVAVSRVEALFLLAQRRNLDPAAFAWERLSADGLALSRDGVRLATAEENLAELRGRFGSFTRRRIPVLERLGIV
ncbi:class I SAM-dependent methyltransferase [Azospirillum rugosum]|uniref:SAM-dependent methyltransferase n=1 Tax=Azospirillum rugosum TaxID=416170 RepID=A0ABS4SHP0_9PROT|nr:methyltransferase regulatory domain-containing protein [Azospirillum rugosum]MBP2292097.1 SAM-dependent methyltransferase [Azospirillum rugosum]MDQ0525767.1 SAM-dependent methyltransferase [Azospirillum rugosum]